MGRMPAFHEARSGHVLKVGLAIPLQGPGGIFGPSCEAVAELYARQSNAASGVIGRQIELEIIDAGAPPALVAAEVGRLIDGGQIDALTGWHISSVREALTPVTTGRIPYVYTPLYEGGEREPGVFCTGETPERQIAPALEWFRAELGLRRWHIVGSDYVWPKRSARAAQDFARDLDLDVLSTSFIRFGHADYSSVLDELEASTSGDGVLMLLVGQDAVEFNREFFARGLQRHLVRFAPLMEENMLLASGGGACENMYVAAGYFRSLTTESSLDLVGAYASEFGAAAPPLNNQAESCLEGITLLAELITAAGSTELGDIFTVTDGFGYESPRGSLEFRGGHVHQQIHLAQAEWADFDVLTTFQQRNRALR
ncbi:ABC-type branched-chain amino acid transport system, substrate-binding protein [Brevibacterium siliguriense]|uniref:ABC-type branched-chain amino acid transport system, substrate-binding protein n=2 Tax=Brevibacterium siliguriense TaxID=1136497 RepID=A0A1H1LK15_9MICO|nr:ABC-type branched-chain amino acid transport system, substrate-binding protein [Brevibacterium siliguriense]